MAMSEEEKERVRKKFEDDIKNIDNNDIEYASKKGAIKVEEMDKNPPSSLGEIWNDIKLMISLITDFFQGKYTEVPWKIMASIVGAIVYFVSPIDIIPDIIPVLGYADDALILKLALDMARDDLILYKKWKEA